MYIVLRAEIGLQQQAEFSDDIQFVLRKMPVVLHPQFCKTGDFYDQTLEDGAQHFCLHLVGDLQFFDTLCLQSDKALPVPFGDRDKERMLDPIKKEPGTADLRVMVGNTVKVPVELPG